LYRENTCGANDQVKKQKKGEGDQRLSVGPGGFRSYSAKLAGGDLSPRDHDGGAGTFIELLKMCRRGMAKEEPK